jgi:hypothetical protein
MSHYSTEKGIIMNYRRCAGLLVLTCLVCGAVTVQTSSYASNAAEKEGKVLKHLVLYKFKAETTPVQVQEVVAAFSALPKKVEGIVGFEHGPNVSPEAKSDGLTYCFAVTFRDEKARDAYLVHPAHQEYVKVVLDKREKVVVFDYWAQ